MCWRFSDIGQRLSISSKNFVFSPKERSASILVKYDTKRIGQFNKSISVYSNASEQPVVLHISGNVEAKVETETKAAEN